MPEGHQGPEALTAALNKKCLEQILATAYNITETKHNKNPSLMNSGPERTTYVPQSSKKPDVAAERLLRKRPTFSKSLMVYVAVSKLGCTELIFVEVNGACYRDQLLAKHMLPAIRRIAGDQFILQQDSALAHRARDTADFLRRSTPQFITPDLWPPNSLVQT